LRNTGEALEKDWRKVPGGVVMKIAERSILFDKQKI
jgi:hypothetical protein